MVKSAKIEDGVVTNVIVGLLLDHIKIPEEQQVGIGWSWNDVEGFSAPAEPALDPLTVADFEAAIQSLIDETAVAKLYASGVALASYANSTNPQWAAEAAIFIAWRDAVWLHSYSEMAKVQAGTRAMPTIDEILAELPAINWPD
ncbi:hypothetical protein [Cohaesibacter celericrescens]|uniref:DUF4376 domain-containing protein n=1 Tax=Cohaesibacter celericrescens TaxID=2067669 RepID=A0A2N5XU10_9HYPH|nr:hypothetical protein [Cohaesibacter celericrescens]PLW77898.1 hypothetical protein C0081_07165 [Cohaesibacter celericrescens]